MQPTRKPLGQTSLQQTPTISPTQSSTTTLTPFHTTDISCKKCTANSLKECSPTSLMKASSSALLTDSLKVSLAPTHLASKLQASSTLTPTSPCSTRWSINLLTPCGQVFTKTRTATASATTNLTAWFTTTFSVGLRQWLTQ